jgi:SNF2 family DNA or RNA helicase
VGPSNENNGSNLSLIIIAAIFISLHVYWDYRIKCNHRDVVIDDEGITFISHNGDAKKINWNEIRSVVEFPSSKDIYEDDFIKNIMSSGIRLSTPEEKFLIFTKMRRFQELKEFISNKLRCP